MTGHGDTQDDLDAYRAAGDLSGPAVWTALAVLVAFMVLAAVVTVL